MNETHSSFLISAIDLEMNRPVSRLWERMPLTRSFNVFSNTMLKLFSVAIGCCLLLYQWAAANPRSNKFMPWFMVTLDGGGGEKSSVRKIFR